MNRINKNYKRNEIIEINQRKLQYEQAISIISIDAVFNRCFNELYKMNIDLIV
jgi:hypothetical protein